MLLLIFFFQAEDGIRDLVRSRGLGDVYKRQDVVDRMVVADELEGVGDAADEVFLLDRGHGVLSRRRKRDLPVIRGPVSYTHLTLPTSDLV